METPGIGNNSILNQDQLSREISGRGQANLTVKTQEGDVVNLQIGSESATRASVGTTTSSDGSTVTTFSAASQAATSFSLTVQGDLNESELAAIQDLATRFNEVSDQFFSGEGSEDSASSLLSGNSDVLGNVSVNLQQAIETTFGFTSRSASAGANPGQDSAEPNPLGFGGLGNPIPPSVEGDGNSEESGGIRDIANLIRSVGDAVFGQSRQSSSEIIQSVPDLIEDILARFNQGGTEGDNGLV